MHSGGALWASGRVLVDVSGKPVTAWLRMNDIYLVGLLRLLVLLLLVFVDERLKGFWD